MEKILILLVSLAFATATFVNLDKSDLNDALEEIEREDWNGRDVDNARDDNGNNYEKERVAGILRSMSEDSEDDLDDDDDEYDEDDEERYHPKRFLPSSLLEDYRGRIDYRTWMKDISNNARLGQLVIPGTHDSGAYRTPGDVGECQDWSPNQQLYNGIRFFDIRLSNNGRSNDFEIRHGKLKLGSFKRLVMDPIKNFMRAYPSETIFISIKRESDSLDVSRLERLFITNKDYKFYLAPINSQTRLGNVRNKVVLFRRYSGTPNVGIRWGHDMDIQDEYKLGSECKKFWFKKVCSPLVGLDYPKKARTVNNFLIKAARYYGRRFYVNFASANYNGMYIGNSAKYANRAVRNYFQTHRSTRIGSIVLMDYPNRMSGTIEGMIRNDLSRF